MVDDLRARLNEMATRDLVAVLRSHDLEEWRPEVFPLVQAILDERGVDIDTVEVGDQTPTEGAGDEHLESVASFATAMEANLCRMALQEAEIDAWLSTEHLAGVAPSLGLAIGVDVLVRPATADAAREVLASIEAGAAALPQEPEPCPRCKSTATAHVQHPDRVSTVSSWFLIGMPFPQHLWRWTCKACAHEWE
jgi:hypothetical protein